MNQYTCTKRDECQCGIRYFAALGYEDEVISEREAITCQCQMTTYCQVCEQDAPKRCTHPKCKVVFCDEAGCASGHDLDGDVYCAAHVPQPIAAKEMEYAA